MTVIYTRQKADAGWWRTPEGDAVAAVCCCRRQTSDRLSWEPKGADTRSGAPMAAPPEGITEKPVK